MQERAYEVRTKDPTITLRQELQPVCAKPRVNDSGAPKETQKALSASTKYREHMHLPQNPATLDLGTDKHGRDLGLLSVEKYRAYYWKNQVVLRLLFEGRLYWWMVRGCPRKPTAEDVRKERERRKKMAELEGERLGVYTGEPDWDDIDSIPQDDGKDALAAIAYTEEYSEGTCRHILSAVHRCGHR